MRKEIFQFEVDRRISASGFWIKGTLLAVFLFWFATLLPIDLSGTRGGLLDEKISRLNFMQAETEKACNTFLNTYDSLSDDLAKSDSPAKLERSRAGLIGLGAIIDEYQGRLLAVRESRIGSNFGPDLKELRDKIMPFCLARRDELIEYTKNVIRGNAFDAFGIKLTNIHPKYYGIILTTAILLFVAFVAIQRWSFWHFVSLFIHNDILRSTGGADNELVGEYQKESDITQKQSYNKFVFEIIVKLPWWLHPIPTWISTGGTGDLFTSDTLRRAVNRGRIQNLAVGLLLIIVGVSIVFSQSSLLTQELRPLMMSLADFDDTTFAIFPEYRVDLWVISLLMALGGVFWIWSTPFPPQAKETFGAKTAKWALTAGLLSAAISASWRLPNSARRNILEFRRTELVPVSTDVALGFFRPGWYVISSRTRDATQEVYQKAYVLQYCRPSVRVYRDSKYRFFSQSPSSFRPPGTFHSLGLYKRPKNALPISIENLVNESNGRYRLINVGYSEGIERTSLSLVHKGQYRMARQLLLASVKHSIRNRDANFRLMDLYFGVCVRFQEGEGIEDALLLLEEELRRREHQVGSRSSAKFQLGVQTRLKGWRDRDSRIWRSWLRATKSWNRVDI